MVGSHSANPLPSPGPELTAWIEAVRAAGGRVWAVGGTVRDAILGERVTDWDMATDLTSDQVARAAGSSLEVRSEPELGTVTVSLDGVHVVWTTLREEADYGPDRRPRTVRFVTDTERDAKRRDFTVNAIYQPLPDGELLDYHGGVEDLRARRLRVIGDAEERLLEDPLRVLRGIRFAARFGLVPDASTRRGLRTAARACEELSPERVRQEIELALVAPGAGRAVHLLTGLGLVAHVLPELGGRSARGWERTGRLLDRLPDGDTSLAWAAVAGELEVADRMLARLHASRHVRRRVTDLLALAAVLRQPVGVRAHELAVVREHWSAESVSFLHALAEVEGLDASRIGTLAAIHRRVVGEPLVGGEDVIAAGAPVGPMVGRVLAEVGEQVAMGRIGNRKEALALVRRLVEEWVKPGGAGGR